jgi:hypothetical protein
VVKAAASGPCSDVEPTKIANARSREIDRDATRMATANENTMPMLANVRSIPDAIPNMSGGAAFMIAELLAGKNMLVPIPLTRLMATMTQSGVEIVSCA